MEPIGSIYTEVSDDFQKGIIGGGIFRCVKAEKHDLGVVMADVKIIGQMDNTIDHTFESANRVYDVRGWHQRLILVEAVDYSRKYLTAWSVQKTARH